MSFYGPDEKLNVTIEDLDKLKRELKKEESIITKVVLEKTGTCSLA